MTFEGLSLAGMATMTPKDFLLHLHKAGYRIVRNVARGITPTASGWDTPPSDLEKATDGDMTTSTGTGSTTTTGSGEIGRIYIEFGEEKSILFLPQFGFWTSGGGERISAQVISEKNGSTMWGETIGSTTGNNEQNEAIIPAYAHTKKIGIIFNLNAAGTGYVKIYEIIAVEVIP